MRCALSAAVIAALLLPATASASFVQEPGSPFDTGFHPLIAQTADFNADGRPDVLTVDEAGVSVLLRRPTGGYQIEGGPIPTGSAASGAAIADFNGDSRPDIAVAHFGNSFQNTVILLRQPGGGFVQGLGSPIAMGLRAGAIAAGDFAGDARPDLAVTDWFNGGVRILRREGAGFVADPIAPTGANPRFIAAADFDGVGGTDLAITNNGGASVTVLLRQGASYVQETGSPHTVGGSPQNVIANDFNGDGRPDLAVTNASDDNVRLLFRQPGGGFAQPLPPVPVGDSPISLATGDFNFDGLPDLVTANQGGASASVLLRSGNGFVPDPSSPVATDTGASGVAVADVDADGRQDIAVANYTDSSVSILLNSTPFPQGPPPPPGPVDADGDGVVAGQDCNDANPAIRPGARDIPGDKIDQNCDGKDAPLPLLRRQIRGITATYPSGYLEFRTLSVSPARKGDRLRLTCKGAGCKAKKKSIRVKKGKRTLSLMKYVRGAELRSGAVVQLRVTRPGTIGRVRTWKVRAPKIPKISDRCVRPGAKKLIRCPRR